MVMSWMNGPMLPIFLRLYPPGSVLETRLCPLPLSMMRTGGICPDSFPPVVESGRLRSSVRDCAHGKWRKREKGFSSLRVAFS